jgi:hypothetical protein
LLGIDIVTLAQALEQRRKGLADPDRDPDDPACDRDRRYGVESEVDPYARHGSQELHRVGRDGKGHLGEQARDFPVAREGRCDPGPDVPEQVPGDGRLCLPQNLGRLVPRLGTCLAQDRVADCLLAPTVEPLHERIERGVRKGILPRKRACEDGQGRGQKDDC